MAVLFFTMRSVGQYGPSEYFSRVGACEMCYPHSSQESLPALVRRGLGEPKSGLHGIHSSFCDSPSILSWIRMVYWRIN